MENQVKNLLHHFGENVDREGLVDTPKRFLKFMNQFLNPPGSTQKELNFVRPFVAQRCVDLGIRYCDRLHITIWDKKTDWGFAFVGDFQH